MAEFFINLDFDSAERYDFAKFMEYTDNYDPLTSSFLRQLPTLPENGFYSIQSEENRPDLVSFRIYGSVQYWWIILAYNAFTSHENIVNGLTIRYPGLEDIENLYFTLKAQQSSQES